MAKNQDRIGPVAALVRTTFLVNAVYAESGREHGLTSQQGQLLCVLMARPYAMGELSALLRLAKSSLSGLVDRTERNGLVRREPDPRDTRGILVTLTPRGSTLAEKFYDETCRRVDELAGGLTENERDLLAGLLGRIVLDNEAPMVFLEAEESTALRATEVDGSTAPRATEADGSTAARPAEARESTAPRATDAHESPVPRD